LPYLFSAASPHPAMCYMHFSHPLFLTSPSHSATSSLPWDQPTCPHTYPPSLKQHLLNLDIYQDRLDCFTDTPPLDPLHPHTPSLPHGSSQDLSSPTTQFGFLTGTAKAPAPAFACHHIPCPQDICSLPCHGQLPSTDCVPLLALCRKDCPLHTTTVAKTLRRRGPPCPTPSPGTTPVHGCSAGLVQTFHLARGSSPMRRLDCIAASCLQHCTLLPLLVELRGEWARHYTAFITHTWTPLSHPSQDHPGVGHEPSLHLVLDF